MNKQIDALIRDITKVGFMPKSEARRRINDIIKADRVALVEKVEKLKAKKKPRDGYVNYDGPDYTNLDMKMSRNIGLDQVIKLLEQ